MVVVVVLGGAVRAIFGWDRRRGSGNTAGGGAHAIDEVFIDPGGQPSLLATRLVGEPRPRRRPLGKGRPR